MIAEKRDEANLLKDILLNPHRVILVVCTSSVPPLQDILPNHILLMF
jgi:hypothetical protein